MTIGTVAAGLFFTVSNMLWNFLNRLYGLQRTSNFGCEPPFFEAYTGRSVVESMDLIEL